jgi:hypothetical protein
VIGCQYVIEHTVSKTPLRFEKPMKITAPTTCKLD